jgi:hypothetical protein
MEIPVTASLDVNSEGDALTVQVRAEGNLKDIQDKALDLARAIPMPRDNCAEDGLNPVVNSVDGASITPRVPAQQRSLQSLDMLPHGVALIRSAPQ